MFRKERLFVICLFPLLFAAACLKKDPKSQAAGVADQNILPSEDPAQKALPGDDMGPPVPLSLSTKVVYRPLGVTQGGYQNIREAQWPDRCVKGDVTNTTGPLFPFSESQTLVVRGPLELSNLAIFQRKEGGTAWTRVSDLSSLVWEENSYGFIKKIGSYPALGKVLENGREIYTHLPGSGEKIIIVNAKMPRATGAPFSAVSQNDVPAVWLLNSKIFQAPSAQYFCNCRGLGNPGGCGELDIAEIIPENKDEVTTSLYSYEGARGAKLSARPTNRFQIYATILRNDNGTGEVSVIEATSFDFAKTELTDSALSEDWLSPARRINSGSESLLKP